MKNTAKIALAALGLATTVTAGAAMAEEKTWTAVTIATEGAFPPFNYLDRKGMPAGFEMELAQEAIRLGDMRFKLELALRELRAGKRLADALAGSGLFAPTGLNLVRVGERSGQLAMMLRTLATLYESAARERMKRFLILLEPVAILLIGAVIGTIMIAIMMAITGLTTAPR